MLNQKEQIEDCILGNLLRAKMFGNFSGCRKFAKAFADSIFIPEVLDIYPTSCIEGKFYHQNINYLGETISCGPVNFYCTVNADMTVSKSVLNPNDVARMMGNVVLKRIAEILIQSASHMYQSQEENIYSGIPMVASLEFIKDTDFSKFKESKILVYDNLIWGKEDNIIKIAVKPIYIPYNITAERIGEKLWKLTHFFDIIPGVSYFMKGVK